MGKLVIHKVTVLAHITYTCRKCGATALSDLVTMELKGTQIPTSCQGHPSNMPVGWASFYDPVSYAYECGRCAS